MTIFDIWKGVEERMNGEVTKFNAAISSADFKVMTSAKDGVKKYLSDFVGMLKRESNSDQIAFRDKIREFTEKSQRMEDYIKNNQKKKSLAVSEKTEMSDALSQAIVREKPNVHWDDVAGLFKAKEALKEAVLMPLRFPEFFTGSRKPWKGILLYGPPGTGKTFLAKACAQEMEESTFFSISSSDIMSKYVGESEKIVKNLFEMARSEKSSIIFIDEVDSMTGSRSEGENDSSRRVKTEFLVQMDGVGKDTNRLLVLGATNLPWQLDTAIRRRFERRIYIPLPESQTRYNLFKKLCGTTPNILNDGHFRDLAERTDGYSGSDITILVKDAVYQPLRVCQKARKFRKVMNEKGEPAWTPVPPSEEKPGAQYFCGKLNDLEGKLVLPDLQYKHFIASMIKVRPSVDLKQIKQYEDFTKDFGLQG